MAPVAVLPQSGLSLVSGDEFDTELLNKYGKRWSPEEVQLYYQILLQGRQDLLICPDQAAGFEMLMLRLIAFSPRSEYESDQGEVKKKPEAIIPASYYRGQICDRHRGQLGTWLQHRQRRFADVVRRWGWGSGVLALEADAEREKEGR